MLTHRRTTATVTDGLGMTARPVGRCKVETARPTKKVRLVQDGAPGTAARPVTKFKAALVRHTGVNAKCLGRPNWRPQTRSLRADTAPARVA
jgi:hypothetical protein